MTDPIYRRFSAAHPGLSDEQAEAVRRRLDRALEAREAWAVDLGVRWADLEAYVVELEHVGAEKMRERRRRQFDRADARFQAALAAARGTRRAVAS